MGDSVNSSNRKSLSASKEENTIPTDSDKTIDLPPEENAQGRGISAPSEDSDKTIDLPPEENAQGRGISAPSEDSDKTIDLPPEENAQGRGISAPSEDSDNTVDLPPEENAQGQTNVHPQEDSDNTLDFSPADSAKGQTKIQPVVVSKKIKSDLKGFIADYKIIEKLGEGGMGSVYKCFDSSLQRDIAIKLLKKEFSQKKTYRARFEVEAQAVAHLRHPNIIQVFRAGEDPSLGCWFFAMEYVEGKGLDEIIKTKNKLPPEEALNYIKQAAEGLKYSHDKGILHRDIKPENIMISKENQAMLADFGLAKILENEEELKEESEPLEQQKNYKTNLTIAGSLMGTPLYMAPERIGRINDDKRSDIYALGMVLYRCLTGKSPYRKSSVFEILAAQQYEEPTPIEEIVPDCPQSIVHIYQKATKKNLEERFQSIEQMLLAIKEVQEAKEKAKEVVEKTKLAITGFESLKKQKTSGFSIKIFLNVFFGIIIILVLSHFAKTSLSTTKKNGQNKSVSFHTRTNEAQWKNNQNIRLFGKFLDMGEESESIVISIRTNFFSETSLGIQQKDVLFSKEDWFAIEREYKKFFAQDYYLAFKGKAVVEDELEPYLQGDRYSFLSIPKLKKLHRFSETQSPARLKQFSPDLSGELVQVIGMIALIEEYDNGDLELLLIDNKKEQVWVSLKAKKLEEVEKKGFSPRIGDIIHAIGILKFEKNEKSEFLFSVDVAENRKDSFTLTK